MDECRWGRWKGGRDGKPRGEGGWVQWLGARGWTVDRRECMTMITRGDETSIDDRHQSDEADGTGHGTNGMAVGVDSTRRRLHITGTGKAGLHHDLPSRGNTRPRELPLCTCVVS